MGNNVRAVTQQYEGKMEVLGGWSDEGLILGGPIEDLGPSSKGHSFQDKPGVQFSCFPGGASLLLLQEWLL